MSASLLPSIIRDVPQASQFADIKKKLSIKQLTNIPKDI